MEEEVYGASYFGFQFLKELCIVSLSVEFVDKMHELYIRLRRERDGRDDYIQAAVEAFKLLQSVAYFLSFCKLIIFCFGLPDITLRLWPRRQLPEDDPSPYYVR